jgi:hypothetical protein
MRGGVSSELGARYEANATYAERIIEHRRVPSRKQACCDDRADARSGRLGAVSEFAISRRSLACANVLSSSPVQPVGGWALPRHQRGVANTELATAADDLRHSSGDPTSLSHPRPSDCLKDEAPHVDSEHGALGVGTAAPKPIRRWDAQRRECLKRRL